MSALDILDIKHTDVSFRSLGSCLVLVQDGEVFAVYCFQILEKIWKRGGLRSHLPATQRLELALNASLGYHLNDDRWPSGPQTVNSGEQSGVHGSCGAAASNYGEPHGAPWRPESPRKRPRCGGSGNCSTALKSNPALSSRVAEIAQKFRF